jgi:hypothetical protein
MRRGAAALLAATALGAVAPVRAQWIAPGDQLRVSYGPKAIHFSPSEDHADWNHLVAFEWVTNRWRWWGADRSMAGLALLDNSFGQFSQYLYAGQEWDLGRFAGGTVSINVTAGLLHGYKGEHKDKIPFNGLGVAPVIIPAAGWRYGAFGAWITLLGANGLLFGVNWSIPLD